MIRILWADTDQVPASDRGLAYGDGIFETLRIQHGRPTLCDRHVERLLNGALRLGIPLIRTELESAIVQACRRYARAEDWVLKLILTRGSGGRGYRPPDAPVPCLILSAHAMPPLPAEGGVKVALARLNLTVNPVLAGLKSLARSEQVLASRSLPRHCFEALMTDTAGRLLEGTRTNLMLRFDDGWLTPPATHLAVAGVMRAQVMDALLARGEPVRERSIEFAKLVSPRCEGMLIMNSVIGVMPVRSIGCVELPVSAGLATIASINFFVDSYV
ncbi:aminodeoxychorismate lyase [Marinobacter salicampi]|uniref:aminodeoxychorismate lyase n=1 Tax=Marinobacter salicampi TaxID=435907 RepID=UPI0014098F5F|nr:aminodeoxychorismate lyase [Marinobacter salicampi]